MEVIILGNNSALAAHGRHPTSQLIKTRIGDVLIDCGEGTQFQLSKYKLKTSRLKFILISHLHGDHFFGLPGLLTSMNLLGHSDPIKLLGPPKLGHILNLIFQAGDTKLNFDLQFTPLEDEGLISYLDLPEFRIFSFPLLHRIPTWGFKLISKKLLRNIIPASIEKYNLSFEEIKTLKTGKSIDRSDGSSILVSQTTLPLRKDKCYAYCSDTKYHPKIIDFIKGADLLYHESTFLNDNSKKAKETFHSTAREAALIAKSAQVGRLLLGHYSSRYADLEALQNEARLTFEHSELSKEGSTYPV